MNDLVFYLSTVEDKRVSGKVRHSLSDIVLLVLLSLLANVEYWEEIEDFGKHYETDLRRYLSLENGIPSHDTIQRVMGMLSPQVTAELQLKWTQLQKSGETDKLKKLLNIDGKTMRGNRNKHQLPLHIVTAYSHSDGICYGQLPIEEKSNEITAIPRLLKQLSIEDTIVTIDAMGTQTAIASLIIERQADYCLAVKQNQSLLYQDIAEYMRQPEFQKEMKQQKRYHRTIEKARGQLETREYFQCAEIDWLIGRQKEWKQLTTIGMVKTTIEKDHHTSVEERFYITSFDGGVMEFARAVRGHWAIESMHWLLDVVFREDANQTLNKVAAQNLNHLRKFALVLLKEMDFPKKKMSYRRKTFNISMNLPTYLEQLFNM